MSLAFNECINIRSKYLYKKNISQNPLSQDLVRSKKLIFKWFKKKVDVGMKMIDTTNKKSERIDEMVNTILKHEGGYVNHPNDRGGPTNFGITQKTLEGWRKKPVSIEDVQNLTEEEARTIYKTNYFLAPKIDKLPEVIQPQMFDMSINHGSGRAVKILQDTLNDKIPTGIDGGIGPQTIRNSIEYMDSFDSRELNNTMVEKRIQFFKSIVRNNESQAVFLKGWIKRAKTFYI